MHLVALLATSGCAVVDPELDYKRTAGKVEKATGYGGLYRLSEDDEHLVLPRIYRWFAPDELGEPGKTSLLPVEPEGGD